MDIILTDEQQSAIKMTMDNPVSILTGGPGSGKTMTCKKIIQAAQNNKYSINLCAPSGKAARRMSEATGWNASTIHKLLEAQMNNGEFIFACGRTNPLKSDLIICDETSMVSSDLMASLLNAVENRTKILFVGDQDQLPSISAGAVLRDFLASKIIPHVNLSKIHRNSGDIVKACHKIKHGSSYTPSATLDLKTGLNLRHIEISSPAKIVKVIEDIIVNRMPERGYDPIWDVQVLCPTNKKTAMSCKGINEILQNSLNKNGPQEKTIFRAGDKVIQTKNKEIDGEYIVNGDIGQVVNIDKKGLKVKFFDPDRIVNISKTVNNLLMAYAITGHRFQGSEAPVIIIPVHKSFSFLVNRPWIYTAISRAQKICITIGQFSAIEKAIRKEDANVRVTRLQNLLESSTKILLGQSW